MIPMSRVVPPQSITSVLVNSLQPDPIRRERAAGRLSGITSTLTMLNSSPLLRLMARIRLRRFFSIFSSLRWQSSGL